MMFFLIFVLLEETQISPNPVMVRFHSSRKKSLNYFEMHVRHDQKNPALNVYWKAIDDSVSIPTKT